MQVRSIQFKDFRSFRGEYPLSFCDPLTAEPRPITVLAGTNGTGKTTVLEAIVELTRPVVREPDDLRDPATASPFVREAWESGYVWMELGLASEELAAADGPSFGCTLQSAAGNTKALSAAPAALWPNCVSSFRDGRRISSHYPHLAHVLRESVRQVYSGDVACHGGVVYFPTNRSLDVEDSVAIEPPGWYWRWVERLDDIASPGTLEKHWVWLNYLDLEQGQQPGTRLRPFSEKIAHLLGRDRRIYIREGRVYVTAGKRGARDVRLNELPSGEKQILLIMGQLALRVRPGMVVLIDEPEMSLHPALQHALIHQLREYARQENVQFILGTHSLEIVQALPTSVLFLDHLEAEPPVVEERAEVAA